MQNRVYVKKSIFASYMGCISYDATGVDIIYRDINILLSHATMSTVHILPKRSWMCYNCIKLASMLPYKTVFNFFVISSLLISVYFLVFFSSCLFLSLYSLFCLMFS